jgi:hypothetical protein
VTARNGLDTPDRAPPSPVGLLDHRRVPLVVEALDQRRVSLVE